MDLDLISNLSIKPAVARLLSQFKSNYQRRNDNACYLPNAFYKLREPLFLLVYGASKFVFPPIVFSTFALLVKKSYAMNYAFRIDRISCVSRKVFAHLA